jgi:hypothetical protein
VTPTERLRELLERERAMGASFDAAWPRAVGKTTARVSSRERDAWRAALEWSRAAWRRAYDLEPAEPHECRLVRLFD